MSEDYHSIPYVSVNPGYMTLYSLPDRSRSKGRKARSMTEIIADRVQKVESVPEDTRHFGIISNQARSKMTKRVSWMHQFSHEKQFRAHGRKRSAKFRLNFITLELASPQIHTDQFIKAYLLNHFLLLAKRKWKVKNYIWRAEPQANGNIHFHIITDKFIPYEELRTVWNNVQNKLGYVDRYRETIKAFHSSGFRVRFDLLKSWSYKEQKKAYPKAVANDFTQPNSTDVHKVRHVRNIPAYLSKYCTKNEKCKPIAIDWAAAMSDDGPSIADQCADIIATNPEARRMIEGRLWGCSADLSRTTNYVSILCDDLSGDVDTIIDAFPFAVKRFDYYTVIYVNFEQWQKLGVGSLFFDFMAHIQTGAQKPINKDRAFAPQISAVQPLRVPISASLELPFTQQHSSF